MSRWIWVSGFSLLGCGDGLVSRDYQGEPLITLRGEVLDSQPIGIEVDHPQIGLFWRDADGGVLAEQSGEVSTEFPARYAMFLFQPPVEGVVQPQEGYDGGVGAVGMLVMYQDANTNGQWDQGTDSIVGVSDRVIAWFDEVSDGQEVPTKQYVDVSPPCAPDADTETLPPRTIHADLTAGGCDLAPDLDCNRATSDWPGVCD